MSEYQYYDQAVHLLIDLRDAAQLEGRCESFADYIQSLRGRHARKPSLMRRLDKAGL